MAETTGISWCDATFNPWVGCSKVSPGCAHCYAEAWAERYDAATWGDDGTRRRTSAANWRNPIVWNRKAEADGRRLRVFCASLADVFEPRPELEPWRLELFALIARTPMLDWLLLTKRPDVARDWLHRLLWNVGLDGVPHDPYLEPDDHWSRADSWPTLLPNIWLGTSIENSRFTWRADALREIPAAVRFLSCEPLLGSLFVDNLSTKTQDERLDAAESVPLVSTRSRQSLDLTGIDWVIVGGESGGRDARPMHPEWAREIRDAVLHAGMPPGGLPLGEHPYDYGYERPAFHFKQWGAWAPAGFVSMLAGPEKGALKSTTIRYAGESRSLEWTTYYRGSSPKAGGKLLDGREWCEFPEREGAKV